MKFSVKYKATNIKVPNCIHSDWIWTISCTFWGYTD